MERKTRHGYTIYPADKWHKYEYLICRDDDNALADIRELIKEGHTLEVHNGFDTFYGVGWGRWLTDGTKDIATAEVTDEWNPGYYCEKPFPNAVVLTPIK